MNSSRKPLNGLSSIRTVHYLATYSPKFATHLKRVLLVAAIRRPRSGGPARIARISRFCITAGTGCPPFLWRNATKAYPSQTPNPGDTGFLCSVFRGGNPGPNGGTAGTNRDRSSACRRVRLFPRQCLNADQDCRPAVSVHDGFNTKRHATKFPYVVPPNCE